MKRRRSEDFYKSSGVVNITNRANNYSNQELPEIINLNIADIDLLVSKGLAEVFFEAVETFKGSPDIIYVYACDFENLNGKCFIIKNEDYQEYLKIKSLVPFCRSISFDKDVESPMGLEYVQKLRQFDEIKDKPLLQKFINANINLQSLNVSNPNIVNKIQSNIMHNFFLYTGITKNNNWLSKLPENIWLKIVSYLNLNDINYENNTTKALGSIALTIAVGAAVIPDSTQEILGDMSEL